VIGDRQIWLAQDMIPDGAKIAGDDGIGRRGLVVLDILFDGGFPLAFAIGFNRQRSLAARLSGLIANTWRRHFSTFSGSLATCESSSPACSLPGSVTTSSSNRLSAASLSPPPAAALARANKD
jgi:hypothetical protein